MLIIKDYQCEVCGAIQERMIESPGTDTVICLDCAGTAYKIISMNHTSPIDCTWLKSVTEVVSKSSKEPHCTEFLKSPTRQNYKNWMKGEGLRPLEKGESYLTKVDRESKLKDMKHKMKKKYRERNALSI